MLDIAVAHEQFRTSEIYNIGLVRSANNLAYRLTKSMQQVALRTCIRICRLVAEPFQTIIHTARNNSTELTIVEVVEH